MSTKYLQYSTATSLFIRGVFVFMLIAIQPNDIDAQSSIAEMPPSFRVNLSDNIPMIITPFVDHASLESEDLLLKTKSRPYRYGEKLDVNIDLENSGGWETLKDGGRVWRVQIFSPGAYSINLVFNQYWLPPGARLFIYSEDRSNLLGAFTEKNNKEHGKLATTLIKGDMCIVEYYEPAEVIDEGKIVISKVIHGYRDLFSSGTAMIPLVLGKELGFGDADTCQNNVYCGSGLNWIDEIRSVGLVVLNDGYAGSGALVNNTDEDGEPFFLTAEHLYSEHPDPEPDEWIIVWNYEANNCNNPGTEPSMQNSSSGATILAKYGVLYGGSDFMLLELQETPESYYQVYYAGWSRSESTPSNTVGIHHPQADIKKISFAEDNVSASGDFWVVDWEDGATEPGSSGSPLLDNNHRIVGQLLGGNAACDSMENTDAYGQFSVSWDGAGIYGWRLSDSLDPSGSASTTLDGIRFGVSGGISQSVKWNGTVELEGNITIPSGVTLTLLANINVDFNGYDITINNGGTLAINSNFEIPTGSTITFASGSKLDLNDYTISEDGG